MKHAILNAKEPPGGHMQIFALAPLSQDIFCSGNFRHSCLLSASVLDESTC